MEVVFFSRTGGRLRTKQLKVGSFQVGLATERGTGENAPCISSGDLLPPQASIPYCKVTLRAGKQDLLGPLPKTLTFNPSLPQLPHLHMQDRVLLAL